MLSSITSHPDSLVLHLLVSFLYYLGTQRSLSLGSYNNQTNVPIPCLPEQASALLRLKSSFSTSGWADGSICSLASWRAHTDCCDWEGVRCGDAEGRVTILDLGDCGFESASLHPALFDLTSLTHLNLAWNSFNGSELPTHGFERLTGLIHLNLSNCRISGRIPYGIGRLTKLVTLDFSTQFHLIDIDDEFVSVASRWHGSSLIEPKIGSLLANLSNLRELYLGDVDLSGNGATWCDPFANSTSRLRVLSLPRTSICGPICGSLSRIHSLTEINLQYNKVHGQIPESFADLISLSVLRLTHNLLEGWFPTGIFQNHNLTAIDISYNFDVSGSLPDFLSHGALIEMLVSNTNFSGSIPGSIRNLKSLNKLGVAVGDSSQVLPSSIGELVSLSLLEVSGTGLIGEIPSWIANLTSLLVLQFTNCGLSGQVPSFIGNLRNLTRLQLYACNFSSQIPPHLFNLTQLEVLNIHSNNFIGSIKLSSFFKLPNLVSLNLSNNKLSVVDGEDNSSCAPIKRMDTLRLASCNISKLPNILKHIRWIQFLDLSENRISGDIPQWALKNWNYMHILNLSYNQFSNVHDLVLPGHLSIVDLSFNQFKGPIPTPGPNIQLLDCSNNQFSSMPLKFASQLIRFSYFKASGNNLSGNIPSSICEATRLVLIDLSYNNLSGSIPSCLMADINYLSVLNLKSNRLQGVLPHNAQHGCGLEALDFSDNWIEGKIPRSLSACRELEVFDIGKNSITDTFPCWMSTLPKLQVLVLKSNKFIGNIGPSVLGDGDICRFPKLRILSVSFNNLSGTLSNEWFKSMKSMITESTNETLVMGKQQNLDGHTYQLTTTITFKGFDITKILRTIVVIDVSCNAFHGVIPLSIGDLVLLNGLVMSHNDFTGQIPSQISALRQLEVLRLSSNHLSGEIPQTLASMNFLSVLNLSYNDLVGRIPESPQFLTFSNLSFLGNVGLCGLQVGKACHNNTPPQYHLQEKSVDVILFIVIGIGFGVGFVVAVVLGSCKWCIKIG
ncbi:hypothetical protein QOZ80_1BG0059380 [Eleusine coracana subsp. coracana]|nr:hypothetical protein QOZ80_1BG0059380 [Eleusine coracana subsp. coracana]